MNFDTNADIGKPVFSSARNLPQVREREVLRVAGKLAGDNVATAAASARQEVLRWAKNQVVNDLPAIAWEGKSFEHLSGGRTCIASAFEDDLRSLWGLRVDRPDRDIAQRIWTTEIAIGHLRTGDRALFSLRLLVSSPETPLRVEPAVPGLVRQIASACGLSHGWSTFETSPWIIESEDDANRLLDLLLDQGRMVPALVCSLCEGESRPVLNVHVLTKATLGIARVIVIPAEFTWVLTKNLGKPLSVYNGAVRAYMPGFSYDANPYAHRLFLLNRQQGSDDAKHVLTALRWIAANESMRRLRLGDDVLAFASVRQAALDFEREQLKRAGSADMEQLRAAQTQIDALKEDMQRAKSEAEQWLSEYETASSK